MSNSRQNQEETCTDFLFTMLTCCISSTQRLRIVWICLVVMTSLPVSMCRKSYSLLNEGDVRATNITDTTVLLMWKSVAIPENPILLEDYRLIIRYRKTGYNPVYVEAQNYDPDCSLTLSHCLLKGLTPESIYSLRLTIDTVANGTLVGVADLNFSTLATPTNDWQWWLLYVGLPCGGALILAIIIIIICARCCGCCCWRKKSKGKISSSTSTSSSKQHSRSESNSTRNWVQTTARNIEMDPPSTYDRPVAYTAMLPSSRDPKHSYLPMSDVTASKYITPIQCEDQDYSLLQTSLTESEPVSNLPPKNRQHSASDPPKTKCMIPLPQLSDKPSLRPAPHQPAHAAPQSDTGCPLYTNTEDVDKLLGSARKMFPSLSS